MLVDDFLGISPALFGGALTWAKSMGIDADTQFLFSRTSFLFFLLLLVLPGRPKMSDKVSVIHVARTFL